jgi:hypothetical protein
VSVRNYKLHLYPYLDLCRVWECMEVHHHALTPSYPINVLEPLTFYLLRAEFYVGSVSIGLGDLIFAATWCCVLRAVSPGANHDCCTTRNHVMLYEKSWELRPTSIYSPTNVKLPLSKSWRRIGRLEVWLRSFLKVNGQLYAPAALPQGKNPDIHWIGGWVGPTARADGFLGEKTPAPAGI